MFFKGYRRFVFLGAKMAAACEIDHSPPSNAEVTNEWSSTFIPPICFNGVDRDNLVFQ
jgi:hypothetical protein